MNTQRSLYYFILLSGALLFQACSATSGLKEGQYLYMGSSITLQDKANIKGDIPVEKDLKLLPPKGTRTGFLNIYSGFYNLYDSTATSGFKGWVKNKLGEAPVIFEDQILQNTEAKIKFYLNGKGYYSSSAACDSTLVDRKVTMDCMVTLGSRYTIDSVIFPMDSTYAAIMLDDNDKDIVLKSGTYYDRNRLSYERSRLTSLANNMGFAGFNPENVFYYVDTAKAGDVLDVYIEIVQPSDSTTHTRYKIESVDIYPNYALNQYNTSGQTSIKLRDSVFIHEKEYFLDHNLYNTLIRANPGEYYSKTNENQTISKLLDIGLFKYVNIRNELRGEGKKGKLAQNIYLTPDNMQSINGEIELNNRSGNFFGSGLAVSYLHRNLFKGAEQFTFRVGGQIEAQLGNDLSFINSSDVNATAELNFPRFILPFFEVEQGRNFIPRTVLSGNYTFQRRVQYYTLTSALFKYGFRWRETRRAYHEVFPMLINRLNVSNTTPEFDDLLGDDRRLQRSFQDVFIAGLQYFYTYNNQSGATDKKYSYFKGEIETSGNLVSVFANDENKLLGTSLARFTKLTLDYRKYFPLGRGDLATRLIIGSGFSYGDNAELPYIKQYLIGGSNSVRAFRLRGLGPGTFVQDLTNIDAFQSQFIDQTGDVKIELNAEVRFPLFNYLKGAFFLEGGNIWLINDEDRPEGNFDFGDFYKEFGIGTGFGFRLDFNFFLLRLDLAFPLRAPEVNKGFQWQFRDLDFFSADWRKDNLRYNIGIGYPF